MGFLFALVSWVVYYSMPTSDFLHIALLTITNWVIFLVWVRTHWCGLASRLEKT